MRDKSQKSKVKAQNYILLLGILMIMMFCVSCAGKKTEKMEIVKVEKGDILASISSTGTVMPRNRLEIKPPLAGRIEEVLVNEGDKVTAGQTLLWMSSNERASLLDAARSKGEEEIKYWQQVYKPAPIIAPLDGFIILRGVEPGQSVTVSDAVLVMADKLIVKAQVDETDLSRIKLGQKVEIILDAFNQNKINGRVLHIAYESQTVNNVVVYEIDVIPDYVPEFFRSGMSASVNFIQSEKKGVMVLPIKAIRKRGDRTFVFVKDKDDKISTKQIEIGQENTENIEVVSGLSLGEEVVVPTALMVQNAFSQTRGMPFSPFGNNKKK